MALKSYLRRKAKKYVRRALRKARPSKALTRAVTKIINRKSETKEASFFGTAGVFPQTGLYTDRAYSGQNQLISSVTSDVKVVMPYVFEGTDDWQRVGNKIQPLSLRIQGTTKIALAQISPPNWSPTDLFAVLFVLQSKQIRSISNFQYTTPGTPPVVVDNLNLQSLLKTEEGTTVPFDGNVWASKLPVAEQNFQVLAKKVFRLRYAGLVGTTGTVASIANSHDYVANWTLNLRPGKHMPKVLHYPESTTFPALPPSFQNSPTNFAPFMVMGYYQADGSSGPAAVRLENTYTSLLRYKDM